PSAKLHGVEGALVAVIFPPRPSTTQSVNVPPMSTPTSKLEAEPATPPPFLSENGSVFVSRPTEKEECDEAAIGGNDRSRNHGLGDVGESCARGISRGRVRRRAAPASRA